jgi:polypeptide N-acetylgalactosaminyltransferase
MVAIIVATFILASRIHKFDLEASLEDHKSLLLQQIEKIKHFQVVKPKTFFDEKHNLIGLKMDWHNYEQIRREKHRFGVGEHGIGVHFQNQSYTEKLLRQKLYAENGFNGLLSDKISLNRSIPDIRLKE